MPITRSPLATFTNAYPAGAQLSTSGSTSANETTNWRIHIQNVEVMYKRVTQYKTIDGSVDFNYLDVNYTMEVSQEHLYWNASAGDNLTRQTLDLMSDSSIGALGASGVIRTQTAGSTRRAVRSGDVESRTRINGNCIVGRQPGAYNVAFDTSGNTNSTVLDMLIAAKAAVPTFEINLVDL